MKNILLLILIGFFSIMTNADEKTTEKLRNRLQLKVQSFAISADGSRILDIGSTTSIYSGHEPVFSGVYTAQFKDLKDVILSYKFSIADDMSMKLDVVEYEHMSHDSKSREPKFSGEIRKQSFAIKDFGSVSWVSKVSADKNIVTRFLPQFSDDEPENLKTPPFAFYDAVIVDNGGRVWDSGGGVTGELAGIISPYGTVYISYSEFPGSKEIGTAKDNDINLKLTNKMTLKIRSSKPVLGFGYVGKVFGVYFPDKKDNSAVTGMKLETFEKKFKDLSQ